MAATRTTNGTARSLPAGEVAANVTEALSRVMAELPGIGKDERAAPQQGGYAYRGIEAITRAVQPLFARHGVLLVPHVQAHEVEHVEVGGKPWTDTCLLVSYTAYGPGGPEDRIEVGPILGIGRDGADKGANKAMTQAYKYALLQLLAVSDTKDDGDAGSIEADQSATSGHQPPWWEVAGYPDEEEGHSIVDGLNVALCQLPADRRGPVREWLKKRGYPGTVPVVVRQADVAALEDQIAAVLSPPEDGAEGDGATEGDGGEPFE